MSRPGATRQAGDMGADDYSEGAVMPRHRLWLLLEDIESQDAAELESLLIALTKAVWPNSTALGQ
jgi:hypothetical protein